MSELVYARAQVKLINLHKLILRLNPFDLFVLSNAVVLLPTPHEAGVDVKLN